MRETAGTALRQQAEQVALSKGLLLPGPPAELQRVLQELQVHQLELELQNEELREAQAGLDASRARYFDLYDLAPVGYCTLSEEGLILEANLTAATLLGVTRAELVERALCRFIVRDDQDVFSLCRGKLSRSSMPQSCELRLIRPDGNPFWASLAASTALDADGAPLHRVIITDISERRLLDEALRETNTQLERARQVADKASQAKSEFLSSMSHEP